MRSRAEDEVRIVEEPPSALGAELKPPMFASASIRRRHRKVA